MDDNRPNPELLLKKVQEEERQQRVGKLKIYLGAAPGVGKTYTMLQDALSQQKEGKDIVIGVAESHGRAEIDALLGKIELLPRQEINYRGQKLSEFNLDGALKRHPQLILMDEMAHTNAPGVRHKKRWQDIKELMDRGIDVYTTLNVQHIESLNDDVSHIIHAPIKETVPDLMIEKADTIELVDLPPEDLLKRLREGKVYIPERVELAEKKFFRKGNLTALRELALRVTAERVGSQVQLYRQGEGIQHIWPTKEKILVCVGPGPESLKLIRSAFRTASHLKAEWIAVYVDTPRIKSTEEIRNSAILNLRLAEQLGGNIRILTGFDVVSEVLKFAREQNVTQIIVWKHIRPRWINLFHRNISDELVRKSEEIDVYIMTGSISKQAQSKIIVSHVVISWFVYIFSFGMVGLATLIDFVLYPFLNSASLVLVYILGVIVVALFGKSGPSVMTSLLSVLAYEFFFMQPFYNISVNSIDDFITLVIMLVVTLIISHLTIITRRETFAAKHFEHQTSALFNLSRQLSNTRGVKKLLAVGIKYINEIFNSDVIALMPENGRLKIVSWSNSKTPSLDEKEMGVAQWVYEMRQIAGLGTGTLPFSNAVYIPLLASKGVIGVLRVQPKTNELFSPEQMRLLESCANQIALSLEVDRHAD